MWKARAELQDGFAFFGAIALIVLAVPFWLTATTSVEILTLDVRHPFLIFTSRHALFLISVLHSAASAYLLLTRNHAAKWYATAAVTTGLLIYEGTPWFFEADSIGLICQLANTLPVSAKVFDLVTICSLAVLMAGSYEFLILDWLSAREARVRQATTQLDQGQTVSV